MERYVPINPGFFDQGYKYTKWYWYNSKITEAYCLPITYTRQPFNIRYSFFTVGYSSSTYAKTNPMMIVNAGMEIFY